VSLHTHLAGPDRPGDEGVSVKEISIGEYWRGAEAAHDARRELTDYLVNRLRGKRSVMHEVATREIPDMALPFAVER
jgi:hypothetical protein